MMFKMTATAQRPGDETERQFGWQDMFVGPDADPRGIGRVFVHHGDERTVLAGYLHDYRLTLELKCAGLDADAMARRTVEPSDLSLLGLVRHLSDAERPGACCSRRIRAQVRCSWHDGHGQAAHLVPDARASQTVERSRLMSAVLGVVRAE